MTNDNIDWEAAEAVAARLGAHTRSLVGARNIEASREWALRMVRDFDAPDHVWNRPRAASYLELAVLLGHREPDAVEVVS